MLLDTVLTNMQKIINDVVIKYDRDAKKNETLEMRKESDIYISAYYGQDSFISYPSFTREVLISAGITDLTLLNECVKDKKKIPMEFREKVIKEQRAKILREYVEQNDYYRQLIGLPDKNDTEYIYIDKDAVELQDYIHEIDYTKPIHEFNNNEITILELTGYMDIIKKNNPTKKYLLNLGARKIDLVTARTANNFAMLRVSKLAEPQFSAEFTKMYEQMREYFSTVLYIREYSSRYDLYDNFMALCIMLATVQQVISNQFKNGITRDFYDWSSIINLFNSYNVPFLETLGLEYQKILVKNLNNLLRYKATDQVIFDICSLLGYERLNVFKYYLVKQQRLNNDGTPVFRYKEVTDADGNKYMVEDLENMFDLYFQSVNIRERNVVMALTENQQKMRYEEITLNDAYWWEGKELQDVLYKNDFNYINTKYISLNITYKMTEMLFEIIHIFKIMIDKKAEMDKVNVTISLPKITVEKEFKLFDVAVFMCALISKRNGFKGNIIGTPSKILTVYGFDFKADFKYLTDLVNEYYYLIDPKVLDYFNNLQILQASDVNRLFVQIREFNDFIVNKMYRAQTAKEYHIYKTIFTTLMVQEAATEMFTKDDGTIAETFLDYLMSEEIILGTIVRDIKKEEISGYVDHVINRLNMMMESLQYLFLLNDDYNPVLQIIGKLIQFFKSYTVDIANTTIFYLFNSKYYNMSKMVEDMRIITELKLPDDIIQLDYSDSASFKTEYTHSENMGLRDELTMYYEEENI